MKVPIKHSNDLLSLDPEHLFDMILILIVLELFDNYVELTKNKMLYMQTPFLLLFSGEFNEDLVICLGKGNASKEYTPVYWDAISLTEI